MRGHDDQTTHMFSYLSPEQRVPADHPLRAIRTLTDEALHTLSRRFAGLYSQTGRPSIPPEQLLRALVLQVLYTVRSERLLMEELNYNLLFRWFVGLNMDDPVWHPTTFTKNRDRLLAGEVAAAFFDAVRAQARAAGLLSDEHFTVDGTQLEAWASLKSFRSRDAAPSDPPMTPGIPRSTSTASGGATTRTSRRPTRRRCCIGRVAGRRQNRRIWATCCWTIGMGSSPTSVRPTRRALPNARQQRCCWRPARPPAVRSGRTRVTTWRALWETFACWRSRPTWRRRLAGVRSTAGPRGMRAITSVSGNGSSWNRSLGG